MKIFTSVSFKNFKQLSATLFLATAILSFSACVKDNETQTATSGLTVVNASPTLATYNVYLNDSKVNTSAIPFGGTISYFQVLAGSNTLKFTPASSTENMLTKVVDLETDKAYSLFLIDKEEKLDGLLVSDDFSGISTDKALIRFINLSPDAGALDLSESAGSVLVSDKAYKAYGSFASTEAKTYSLDLKDKASGTVLKTQTDVNLVAGAAYTIIASGMVNPTGNDHPLQIQVVKNQ